MDTRVVVVPQGTVDLCDEFTQCFESVGVAEIGPSSIAVQLKKNPSNGEIAVRFFTNSEAIAALKKNSEI